jgi:hypothetical protein
MKERPILFSAPMVRSLLDGCKTQTRRIVKRHVLVTECPYGWVGDRLWVRETFAPNAGDEMAFMRWEFDSCGPKPEIHFAADGGDPHISRWRPSIHMPRWASRILLEIVSVRVEQLQDISDEDCLAEGIHAIRHEGDGMYYHHERTYADPDNWCHPDDAYRALWNQINGAGSWDANPWVWAVEFKRVMP